MLSLVLKSKVIAAVYKQKEENLQKCPSIEPRLYLNINTTHITCTLTKSGHFYIENLAIKRGEGDQVIHFKQHVK